MVINILRDMDWINSLEGHNQTIRDVHYKYTFKSNYYDLTKNEASDWFHPEMYRLAQLSRTYPDIDRVVNNRSEYKLIFYLPNYVSLFLIKELYSDRKDVLIEDVGTGNGNLLFFLSKLGFSNFHTIEIFCHCPKSLFDEMMQAGNINCKINDLTLNPVIVNNCSAPKFCFITLGLDKKEKRDLSNLELIIFYANRIWEEQAPKILEPQGYSFLCRDKDDMGLAWCRNDKWGEFTEKLDKWRV